MSKYLIDTENMTITESKYEDIPTSIATAMESCIGSTEYDDTVKRIQKWYYGREIEAAWCATGLSYFSNLTGHGDETGKHENVDRMKEYMMEYNSFIINNFQYPDTDYETVEDIEIRRGDVVFMSSKHTINDCTHVGVVSAVDNAVGTLCVCSCNINSAGRKDGIYLNVYNYKTDKYIVGFGMIKE